jgi:hypothetical protein
VGLYSDAAGGALFDDVEVRPTNAFSESSYVGHSRQFIALSSQSFDEVGELAEWGVSGGQWRVEDGSLRGSGPGKPVIVNRGVYSGEFQIEFEVRLIPGQSLLLHTDGVQGRQSFLLEPRHDEVQVGAFLGVESIGAVTSHFEGERARFRLRRMESRYRLDLDNRDLLDVPALDRGPIVFSFEAAGESVSVDSFHVSQIPLYLYNPWDAPVGWGPSRGTIGMGHAFVYAHAEGDEAAIWHDEAFGCRDWLYSPILAIRADAPFGSWIELVLCHQEGADSRDIAVRYQLVDKPKLFQSGSTREAQLTLRRGQQVLGRAAVELAVDRTGFVALNLEVRSAELGTFVFVDDAPVIEVENLEPSGAGKLGFRFSYGKGGMPGQLGVLFFSIYPGASEDAEDARPNAETGPMRDATPAAAQPSAALHR